ncbi:hypothetical protein Droror1_Dr00018721 [Drosera rotundifolia]
MQQICSSSSPTHKPDPNPSRITPKCTQDTAQAYPSSESKTGPPPIRQNQKRRRRILNPNSSLIHPTKQPVLNLRQQPYQCSAIVAPTQAKPPLNSMKQHPSPAAAPQTPTRPNLRTQNLHLPSCTAAAPTASLSQSPSASPPLAPISSNDSSLRRFASSSSYKLTSSSEFEATGLSSLWTRRFLEPISADWGPSLGGFGIRGLRFSKREKGNWKFAER